MNTSRSERLKVQSAARRQQQKLELRRSILDAAGALFLEHGSSGFSLRQVAETIGYSPTTVYLYFENKEDLLFEVCLEGFETFGKLLEDAAASSPDPLERIYALGHAYVAFGTEHPAHYRLMFMERGDFLHRQDPKSKKPTIDSFQVLVAAVYEAHAAGLLRPGDPLDYVYSLWAGVHGLVALWLSDPKVGQQDISQRADHLLAMLKNGFAANPGEEDST